jgi:hypothetical protein
MNRKKINYSEITPDIAELAELAVSNSRINPELYEKYEVKRGLRDINGKGVLTGSRRFPRFRLLPRRAI